MAAKKKQAVKKKVPAKKKPVKWPPVVRLPKPPKCNQDKICDWLQGTATTLRFASPLGYVLPGNGPATTDAWVEQAQWCIEQLVIAVRQLEKFTGVPNPIFHIPGGGGTPPPPPPTYPPN